MCFSATASFTASAALGLMGVATLVKTKNKKSWPLFAVPLAFGAQQFIEGLLWLSLKNGPSLTLPMTYAFLFFAFLFWPIYMPVAAYIMEPEKIRRQVMFLLGILGAVVGVLLYVNFVRNPEAAQILNRCLFYPDQIPYPSVLGYLYVIATIGPGMISSQKIIRIFSVLVLVFALIAWIVYTRDFTSVWCFFAAIISLVLYFYPEKKV
ncbi:MAG: hypothetical protein NT003_03415 [Candidatus Magasanikbacteria bacterium]|nr:hypothetical protein [Candidatus Magasanikbacteria bacterium]